MQAVRDDATMLTLLSCGRVALATRVDMTVGRSSLGTELADRQYLGDAQFRLDVDPATGRWSIVPLPSTVNETLLDGAPLRRMSELSTGQVIAVGNSRKGIVKLPLVVSLEPDPHAVPASAAEVSTPELAAPEPAPALPATEPAPAAVTSSAHPAERATVPTWARTLGAIAGGLLMGALSAAASTGRGTYVRRGRGSFGEVILTVDGTQVYEGRTTYGTPVMIIDGDKVRRGMHRWSEIVAHLDGDLVRAGGNAWGDVIACLDGPFVREGRSSWGEVLACVEGGRRMAGAAAAAYLLKY